VILRDGITDSARKLLAWNGASTVEPSAFAASDSAFLRLGGGCVGCGMVAVTLKQGVESAIRAGVPEITRVVDVTDHASGTNPYYEPTAHG
jgi:Fe-S cluster biogenesis protein NfuA